MAFPPPPQRRPDATAAPIATAQPTLPPAPPVVQATATPQPASVTAPATFAFGKPQVDEAAAQAKLAAEITAKTVAQAAELQQAPVAAFAPKPAPVASAPAPVAAKAKKAKKAFGSATIPIPAVGGVDPSAVLAAFVEFFKQDGCPSLDSIGEAVKKLDQSQFPDSAAGRKAFRASAIILAVAQWASKKQGFQKKGDAKGPLAKYRGAMIDLLAMAGLDAVAKKWGVEKLSALKLTTSELQAAGVEFTAAQVAAYGIVA